MVKDHYVFAKKNIKLIKNKKYKAWRGKNTDIPDFCLQEQYHKDHFEKFLKKIKDRVEEHKKGEFKKENVFMPTQKEKEEVWAAMEKDDQK